MNDGGLQTVELLESTYGERKLIVDRTNHVVKGVKILGPQSRNAPPHNNQYPEQTRRKAAAVLEGGRCFVNHDDDARKQGQTRRYQDSFGVHKNIREEGDGLYSDFHYNPGHPVAEQFAWDAEHAPENVGFSIATNGRKRMSGGQAIVEEILFDRAAHSIDLVCKGATTNSISESQRSQRMSTTTQTVKAALREFFKGDATKLKIVEEELPAAAVDASMPAPAEGASEADPMDTGFKAMLSKLVDQYAAGDIDLAGLIAKLKDIDKAWTKLAGDGGEAAPAAEPATESQRTDPTLGQLREELNIRDLIEDAGLKFASPVSRKAFVKSLVPLSEAERTALIDERKANNSQGSGTKARSAGTTQPAGAKPANGTPIAEGLKPSTMTPAERVAYLRNGRLPTPAKN